MGKITDRPYSILIVSAVEQLNTFVKKNISDRHFTTIEVRKSAALAAQELLNRHYDVIIVNAPLPDNFGVDFVLDICGRYTSGIIILSPGEVADDVTERVIDHGVVVLAKPMTARGLVRNIRHLIAIQNKFHDTEKKLLSMEDKASPDAPLRRRSSTGGSDRKLYYQFYEIRRSRPWKASCMKSVES